jgi:hypothetical protein
LTQTLSKTTSKSDTEGVYLIVKTTCTIEWLRYIFYIFLFKDEDASAQRLLKGGLWLVML